MNTSTQPYAQMHAHKIKHSQSLDFLSRHSRLLRQKSSWVYWDNEHCWELITLFLFLFHSYSSDPSSRENNGLWSCEGCQQRRTVPSVGRKGIGCSVTVLSRLPNQRRPSLWGHDAFPPCFRFPPIFEKFSKFYLFPKNFSIFIRQNFWWPFLSHRLQIYNFPLFSLLQYISSLFRESFHLSPTFTNFPHVFFVSP